MGTRYRAIQVCKSVLPHVVYVESDSVPGIVYTVYTGTGRDLLGEIWEQEATCTCPDYTYRARYKVGDLKCKHIAQAIFGSCGWREDWSEQAQSARERRLMLCPVCNQSTVKVTLAPSSSPVEA